jgi:hypothetical protein
MAIAQFYTRHAELAYWVSTLLFIKSMINHTVQADKGNARSALDLDEEELLNNAPLDAKPGSRSIDKGFPDSSDLANSASAFFYEPASPKHLPQEPSLLLLATFAQVRFWAILPL